MDKNSVIRALKVVYQKMKDDIVIKRDISFDEAESALKDYFSLIEILEMNDWDTLGRETLGKLGGINGKYFGKGEIVGGFCPKTISYEESSEAQKALYVVVDHIRRRTDPDESILS